MLYKVRLGGGGVDIVLDLILLAVRERHKEPICKMEERFCEKE